MGSAECGKLPMNCLEMVLFAREQYGKVSNDYCLSKRWITQVTQPILGNHGRLDRNNCKNTQ